MEDKLWYLLFPELGAAKGVRRAVRKAIGKEKEEQFLGKLPWIREVLEADLAAALAADPAAESREEILHCYPGFYAVAIHRLAHTLWDLGVPLLPRKIAEKAHSVTGIDIHPGATVGRGFFIDHGTGVVVGETAVIGENVRLYQGVTLGALSTRGGQSLRGVKRHPTVEDGVTIYANATVLGGSTVVGRGSIIGANVFLTESVAPNTQVTAAPPQLRFRKIGE